MHRDHDLFEQLNKVVNGRWDKVVMHYQALLVAAQLFPRHCGCPLGNTGRFRFKKGWQQHGIGYHDKHGAMHILEIISGIERVTPEQAFGLILDTLLQREPIKSVGESNDVLPQNNRELAINRVLAEATLANDSEVAKAYFLTCLGKKLRYSLPSSLLFHPSLPYYEWDETTKKAYFIGHHPALISKVIDQNSNDVTLYCTYLQVIENGLVYKLGAHSFVSPGKYLEPEKFMAPTGDMQGVHTLLPGTKPNTSHVVCYCESLEAAVAIREATGLTVKACFSSALLGQQSAAGEETCLIFANRDISRKGQHAAFDLSRKLRRRGKEANVYLPTLPITVEGVDFLDEYRLVSSTWEHWGALIARPVKNHIEAEQTWDTNSDRVLGKKYQVESR
ncbi:hypothetical protein [Pseudoalteromonas sp. T1lg23B]|uniref:hypothetical protein n=1 Tax=Pseudoalteromonas sp. T1lg23B TaxID=2077097 RepID=UPI000CF5E148|nr:hypothetical protein [Pseudoalteromonas sp. T1lg23B]